MGVFVIITPIIMFSSLIFIFYIIILFYSIIFHEVAHGYAAYRNGDNTALNAGRLTLNPISHIDFIGSILVPLFSYFVFGMAFGWAKPVPYNPNNIKHKKYAELEVASAGILFNFFIAFLAVLLFHIFKYFGIIGEEITYIFQMITSVNLFLALFNLLPFPPADGFSIFTELFSHLKDLFFDFKNIFRSKKEIKTIYTNTYRNKAFQIKHIFSSPISMIVIIFVAINLFQVIIPYILSFINYLY